MVPEDLSSFPDEDLYALEEQRTLDPESWARIDDELRRRRAGRRASLADVSPLPGALPSAPTLGDLERVAAELEASLAQRLAATEARVRRLRAWIIVAPLVWMVVAAGVWLALEQWAPDALRALARTP